jgi:hypothetical protein
MSSRRHHNPSMLRPACLGLALKPCSANSASGCAGLRLRRFENQLMATLPNDALTFETS